MLGFLLLNKLDVLKARIVDIIFPIYAAPRHRNASHITVMYIILGQVLCK